MKRIVVGKTRKVTGLGRKETWVKAEMAQEFDGEPTYEQISEMAADIETILNMEEESERIYWKTQDKLGK